MGRITRILMAGIILAGVGGVAAMAEPLGPEHDQSCIDGHRRHGSVRRGGPGFHSPAMHLTALKTDLGIKPEQLSTWSAYAKVVRDTAVQMAANRATLDMDAVHAMPNRERAAFLSDQMDLHDQAKAKIKAAAEALLPALDDAQKTKAQKVLPGLATRARGGPERAAGRGRD